MGDASHGEWERLAEQALSQDKPGLAVSCFVQAEKSLEKEDPEGALVFREKAKTLRLSAFPPYPNDDALISDVSQWVLASIQGLRRSIRTLESPKSEDLESMAELHQTWFFRLMSTREEKRFLRIDQLAAKFSLDSTDITWCLALLAYEKNPGLRRRHSLVFGHDGQLTVGILGRLLSQNRNSESRFLSRLHAEAPLVRYRLLSINIPMAHPNISLRGRFLELDESVPAFIEGRLSWPSQLNQLSQLHPPKDRAEQYPFQEPKEQLASLEKLFLYAKSQALPGAIALATTVSETSLSLALALGKHQNRPLLVFNARQVLTQPLVFQESFRLAMREAILKHAILYVTSERQWEENAAFSPSMLSFIQDAFVHFHEAILFDAELEGDEVLRRHLAPIVELRVMPPNFDEQVEFWTHAIESAGLRPISEGVLRSQVLDMGLQPDDIYRSVRLARDHVMPHSPPNEKPEVPAPILRSMAASKIQTGLRGIADKISTSLGWEDVVLKEDILVQLMEIITYSRYQKQVFEEWGFGAKLPYGRSNSSLFTGPPGTGKTMVAGIIAREIGMELYRIDVSQIVSKYVGETEKNIAKIFDEASRSHAVLLFDEADSLFGKRTQVQSSHDRYANIEVNYLLQRIEAYDGVAIMTTNFAENIDEAFARRIKFRVEFPFPSPAERERLWQLTLPAKAHVQPGINWTYLGEAFELSGGSIKNAVLRAAFRAAELGSPISDELLQQAGTDECRALGKVIRTLSSGLSNARP